MSSNPQSQEEEPLTRSQGGQDAAYYLSYTMRSHVLEAVLVLCTAALSNAFTVPSCALKARHMNSAITMSSSSQSGFGTRRDLIHTAGAAVAGVVGSSLLPVGALAAAAPDRKGMMLDNPYSVFTRLLHSEDNQQPSVMLSTAQ